MACVCRGLDAANPGRAALAASGGGLCALVAAAIVVPAAVGPIPPVAPVEARVADAVARRLRRRRRPLALEFTPLRVTDAC